MKVLVIGLGSMGKRRIRLLLNHYEDILVIGIDSNEERLKFCNEEYNIPTYRTIEEAKIDHNIDCAFVCTSPLSHNKIIEECLNNYYHVFTELNLVTDGYEENIALANKNKKTLFLSSTALYRKEMRYIIDAIQHSKEEINYTYHVGQYLPDWHPWENISDYFVSNPKTNGCRELMAIELPWMFKAFGKVKEMKVFHSKMTDLKINYDDNYMILLQHENNIKGVFIVDIVSREAVRKFSAYGENMTITWEGKPDTLRVQDISTREWSNIVLYEKIDKLSGYSSNIIENQYLDEIKEFFAVIEGRKTIEYGFEEDLYTLNIIDKIERS